MRERKCITLLRTLSKRELGQFDKYLKSNHKKKDPEIKLLAFIKPFAPKFSSSKLIIENALKYKLKEKGFTKTTIISKLSSLYQLLKEFLLWKKITNDSFDLEKEKMLLDIFQERGVEDLRFKKIDNLIDLIKGQEPNMWSYLNLAKLESLKYFSNSDFKKKVKGNGLKNIVENIDGFYIGARLKYACEQMYQRNIAGKTHNPNLLNEIKLLAQQEPYKSDRLFIIYQSILDLAQDPDKQKYLTTKALITDAYRIEEQWEQSIIFGFLLNYLAGEIKKGDFDYGSEAEEWINFGLENNIVLENGYLHSTIFNNLINIACSVNKLDFAKDIINTYESNLKADNKEKTIKIARAYINFEEGNFDAVLQGIQPMSFPQKIMDLKARVIVLKSLYELNRTDELLLYFEAFRKSIQRTRELSSLNKKSTQNLIKHTESLLDPNLDLQQLEEDIKKPDFLFGKTWLLKKLEEKRKK